VSDLSLDLPTRDLLVIDNDLVLTSDVDPNGTNSILQDILQRLRLFLGEWFLDNTQGVPYFQQVFVKNPQMSKIEAIFIEVILSTSGVDSLIEYSFKTVPTTRRFEISFSAQTTKGVVDYSGTLISGGQS
jgi:hypothetical protein